MKYLVGPCRSTEVPFFVCIEAIEVSFINQVIGDQW